MIAAIATEAEVKRLTARVAELEAEVHELQQLLHSESLSAHGMADELLQTQVENSELCDRIRCLTAELAAYRGRAQEETA